MRRIMTQEKKKPGEFRMLRCLSIADNVGRLKKHVWRLERKLRGSRPPSGIQLKAARLRRVVAA